MIAGRQSEQRAADAAGEAASPPVDTRPGRRDAPLRLARGLPPAARETATQLARALELALEKLRVSSEELAEARDAVEAERRRYHDLFEFAPEAYIVTDTQGVIEEANSAAADLLHRPQRSLAGKPLVTFIDERDHQAFRAALPTWLRDGDGGDKELTLRLKSRRRQQFVAAMTAAVVRDRHGGASGLRWLVRTITEQRRGEVDVRALNAQLAQRVRARTAQLEAAVGERNTIVARYRALVKTAPNPIIVVDEESNILLVNEAAEQSFGYGRDELLGQPYTVLIPERLREPRAAYYAAYRSEPRTLVMGAERGLMARRKDGTEFPAEINLSPAQTASGLLVTAIVRDVSDRRRSEDERAAALERSQHEWRRLQALIDTSPVGLMVLEGPEERVLLLNREMERLLGFSIPPGEAAPAFALNKAQFVRPDGSPYAADEFPSHRALLLGETVRAEEMVFVKPDGRRTTVLVNATPVPGSEGAIESAIVAVQDLTPLEQLERLRNEFLGMVTHELRTPLTSIKGAAITALTSRTPTPCEESRELFQVIDEQSDRLREMVDSLLDMTRIQAGVLSIHPSPVDIRDVIAEAVAAWAREDASHTIRVEGCPELPRVQVDSVRLMQVITNLLANATKFSPAGTTIGIMAAVEEGHVVLSVRDEGRGIPPEKLHMLFQKFSQVHEDVRQGAGLGLAICRGIVEAHGGRIWAESGGTGQGTTVKFTLPIAGAAVLSTTPRSALPLRSSNGQHHVLVVDDDAQIVRYLKRTLEAAGNAVTVASDGGQVIDLVDAEQPDLVLLDLGLPGVTGFDVLRRIREFSGVPVIILTASDRMEDSVQALTLGADDYIRKPFAPSELLARMAAVLRRRDGGAASERIRPYQHQGLMINFVERLVTTDGDAVALSATEYKLLYELATHAGQVLTYDQLLDRVWGVGYEGGMDLVRSFVRNLRRKLGDDARHPRYVLTERQVGYRMAAPS